MKRPPRVFFSFRSPFSWIALERLQRQLPGALDQLELIPYWEPNEVTSQALATRGAEIRYIPMSKAKHLYILQDTKRLAESLGLKMAWPVDIDPTWEVPHLGWIEANRQGRGIALYRAIVEARWLRGENICDPPVIHRLAQSVGLNGEQIVGAPDHPDIRSAGVDALYDAWEDDIFGVPYFRHGRERFWGVDRLDGFIKVWRSSGEAKFDDDIPGAIRERVGAYDRDTSGGCG